MARERVQTRCDPDTVAAIEKYAEQADISESEAVRRLLRRGIEHTPDVEGYAVAAYPGTDESDAVDLLAGDSGVVTQDDLLPVVQILLLLAILGVLLL